MKTSTLRWREVATHAKTRGRCSNGSSREMWCGRTFPRATRLSRSLTALDPLRTFFVPCYAGRFVVMVGGFEVATFILIHGAWHGGWCWERLVPVLTAEGHHVLAPDLPGMEAEPRGLGSDPLGEWADFVAE